MYIVNILYVKLFSPFYIELIIINYTIRKKSLFLKYKIYMLSKNNNIYTYIYNNNNNNNKFIIIIIYYYIFYCYFYMLFIYLLL